MTLFKSLAHRPFALLWSGQTTSRLGDSLYRIALAWWVLEKTGSAAAMGTVLIFSFTPMLLFLLVGGVVVDRLPRLRVMLASDLLSGAVVSVVAWLAWSQRLEIWHVYIASTLFGLVEAFFFPAYAAVVPEILPGDSLPSANSLTSVSQQVTGIAGPALGAWVVALGGTPAAFAFDALSFFAAAACIASIGRQPPAPLLASEGRRLPDVVRRAFADLREGASTVLGSPWLWMTIAIFGFVNITFSAPISVALPFLVKDNLHADVGTFGLFQSLSSLGYVAGAVWLGRFARLRRRGPLAYTATLLSGATLAVFGLPAPVPALMVAALLGGLFISIFGLIWINTLQELVPRDRLGRVSSIDALGSYVLLPIGFGLVGWTTDWLGAPLVFIIGGALTVGLALLGLAHPAIRGLD